MASLTEQLLAMEPLARSPFSTCTPRRPRDEAPAPSALVPQRRTSY